MRIANFINMRFFHHFNKLILHYLSYLKKRKKKKRENYKIIKKKNWRSEEIREKKEQRTSRGEEPRTRPGHPVGTNERCRSCLRRSERLPTVLRRLMCRRRQSTECEIRVRIRVRDFILFLYFCVFSSNFTLHELFWFKDRSLFISLFLVSSNHSNKNTSEAYASSTVQYKTKLDKEVLIE